MRDLEKLGDPRFRVMRDELAEAQATLAQTPVFGWLEHRNADWMSRLVGVLFCEDEVVHVLTMEEARRIASNANKTGRPRPAHFQKTGELLFVTNAVNADDCARCVFDRLIAGDKWYAHNRCLAVVWFTCVDRVEGRAAQFASKRLWQGRCNADIFVPALHEQARPHPFAALLRDLMDDGKVVVHLCRAEIQGRGILSANGLLSFNLWCS